MAIDRMLAQLDRSATLRAAAADNAKLQTARKALRAWQAARLARTHADLLASPRMGLAASFFLTELCGSEDLTKIEGHIRRVAPAMKRVLPAAGLETVAESLELEALSEDLDLVMSKALAAKGGPLTPTTYGALYREVDRRADRERQIELIDGLGRSLDRLVHKPLIGSTLSMMRRPAKLAGLGDLQEFLQRGYTAFLKMGGASEFLDLIVGKERELMGALFAQDDSLLGE